MRELDRTEKTVNTYFPNGVIYSSAVYENNKITKCSKYYTNGCIAQKIGYSNGMIVLKEQYNRAGDMAEVISYAYDAFGQLEKITREKTNNIDFIIFERDEIRKRIVRIYVKHNNIIIRRLEYTYYGDSNIECHDADYNNDIRYRITQAPCADESWLNINPRTSMVMRKLRTALELSA